MSDRKRPTRARRSHSSRSDRTGRRPRLDALEPRTLLSATPVGVDKGDFYVYEGQPSALMQATDRILLRVSAGADGASVVGGLTADGGLLAGGVAQAPPIPGYWYVDLADPLDDAALTSLLAKVEAVPGVADAAETYFTAVGGERLEVTQDVYVSLRPGVDATAMFAGAGYLAVKPVRGTDNEFVVTLDAPAGRAVLTAADTLSRDPRVAFASPDFIMHMTPYAMPNDPLASSQWHLQNTGQNGGKVGADANVMGAWNLGYTGQGITVAVLDDSVQINHPDLVSSLWTNPGEVAGDGIDNDGNGYIDDIHGWDFLDNDNDPSPVAAQENHGTSVSGVAVATGNNNLGVASPAYEAKLMGIRMLGYSGQLLSHFTESVYYVSGRTADGKGTWKAADVANHSYGGAAPMDAVQNAFAWSASGGRGGLGLVNFVATGNGADVPGYTGAVNYPAGYPTVIAVGGSTDGDVRVSYSDYGPNIWIVAPTGGYGWNGRQNIVTTDREGSGGYDAGDYTGLGATGFAGTSSATPLASGVGALILSANPKLTLAQMKDVLKRTSAKIGGASYDTSGWNVQYGYGRIDAAKAVADVVVQVVAKSPTGLTENTAAQNKVYGTLTLPGSTTSISDYTVTVNLGNGLGALGAELLAVGTGTYNVILPSVTYQEGGTYPFVIQVSRDGEVVRSVTGSATVSELPIALTAVSKSLSEGVDLDTSDDLETNRQVLTFVDTDPDTMTATSYTAVIDWGDGTTSAGTVRKLATGINAFEVVGTHAYSGGGYTITVTVYTPGGVPFTATAGATVVDSALEVQERAQTALESTQFAGSIAHIADSDPRTHSASFYSATIDWGDGPYRSKDVGRAIPDYGTVAQPLVSVLYLDLGTFRIADLDVNLTILHDRPSDLTVVLISPTGLRVPLVSGLGRTGANLIDLRLDDSASRSVNQASAPYTGSYRPTTSGALAALNGWSLNGLWQLEVTDHATGGAGQLVSWSLSARAQGTIVPAAGGGFDVYGQHLYDTVGSYTPTVVVTDSDTTPTTGTTGVTVENAPLTLRPLAISTTEGTAVSGIIAYMDDANVRSNPDAFRVMIDWKDGTAPTAGRLWMYAPSRYAIVGEHAFERPSQTASDPLGTFPVEVTVYETTSGLAADVSQTTLVQATVGDFPLTATGSPFVVTEGQALGSVAVVRFRDGDTKATAAGYTATVDWGDGRTGRPATIQAVAGQPGVFDVFSPDDVHPVAGSWPAVVTITDLESGFTYNVAVAGRVLDAALVASGQDFAATERTGSGLVRVALFHDDNLLSSDVSQFAASIVWGDGTSPSLGTIRLLSAASATSPALYEVLGQHTYGEAGSYAVTATIRSSQGSTVMAQGKAVVANLLVPLSGSLEAAWDTGVSATDGVTARNQLVLSGQADGLSTVNVYAQSVGSTTLVPVGTASADGTGAWRLTTSALADGSYELFARATDAAGDPASALTALTTAGGGSTFTIDTAAPRIAAAVYDRAAKGFRIQYADGLSGITGAGSGMLNASNYVLTLGNRRPATATSVTSVPGAPGSALVKFGSRGLTGRATLSINSGAITDAAGNAVVETFFTANPVNPTPAEPWVGVFNFNGRGAVVSPTQLVTRPVQLARLPQRRLVGGLRG
jgi:subtilisin family serine protease/subtilisin-like proprotein convertase family protein